MVKYKTQNATYMTYMIGLEDGYMDGIIKVDTVWQRLWVVVVKVEEG